MSYFEQTSFPSGSSLYLRLAEVMFVSFLDDNMVIRFIDKAEPIPDPETGEVESLIRDAKAYYQYGVPTELIASTVFTVAQRVNVITDGATYYVVSILGARLSDPTSIFSGHKAFVYSRDSFQHPAWNEIMRNSRSYKGVGIQGGTVGTAVSSVGETDRAIAFTDSSGASVVDTPVPLKTANNAYYYYDVFGGPNFYDSYPVVVTPATGSIDLESWLWGDGTVNQRGLKVAAHLPTSHPAVGVYIGYAGGVSAGSAIPTDIYFIAVPSDLIATGTDHVDLELYRETLALLERPWSGYDGSNYTINRHPPILFCPVVAEGSWSVTFGFIDYKKDGTTGDREDMANNYYLVTGTITATLPDELVSHTIPTFQDYTIAFNANPTVEYKGEYTVEIEDDYVATDDWRRTVTLATTTSGSNTYVVMTDGTNTLRKVVTAVYSLDDAGVWELEISIAHTWNHITLFTSHFHSLSDGSVSEQSNYYIHDIDLVSGLVLAEVYEVDDDIPEARVRGVAISRQGERTLWTCTKPSYSGGATPVNVPPWADDPDFPADPTSTDTYDYTGHHWLVPYLSVFFSYGNDDCDDIGVIGTYFPSGPLDEDIHSILLMSKETNWKVRTIPDDSIEPWRDGWIAKFTCCFDPDDVVYHYNGRNIVKMVNGTTSGVDELFSEDDTDTIIYDNKPAFPEPE